MTTYKHIKDSWIQSKWIDSNIEIFGENELFTIPDNVEFGSVKIEDLIDKKVTKTNYLDIVKLSNYIMLDNVDDIVDEIVRVTKNINVVYEFEDFYRLSKRLVSLNKYLLKENIENFNEYESFFLNGHSNFWDISNINDMSKIFMESNFNGDISRWNVSNVKNMSSMFYLSKFNGDISQWNVSNVEDMSSMFYISDFNGDISQWNVSNVKNMRAMFFSSNFNGDISQWHVYNVKDMSYMFYSSNFNKDISQWNVSNVENMGSMFYFSNFKGNISEWNVCNV